MATYPTGTTANAQGSFLPFGGVGGNVTSQSIVTAFNIFPPNNLLSLYQRHDDPVPFNHYLAAIGASKGTATPTTGHYENDWYIDNVSFGRIVTPASGIGQPIVVEISASDMTVVNGQNATYVNQYDLIDFGPGVKAQVIDKNTSVFPYQLTLQPNLTTVNLNTYVNLGVRYAIAANAFTEGSPFGQGRVSQVFKYNNSFQYIKDNCEVTGSELTNTTVFEPVAGKEGTYFMKVQDENYKRHQFNKDQVLLFGSTNDNFSATSPALGYSTPTPTTEGMVDFIYNYGQKNQYNAGLVTVQDFDQNGRILTAQRVFKGTLEVQQGFNMFINIENALKDYAGAKEKFVTDIKGEEKFEINVGFYSFQKASYRYNFMQMPQFSFVKAQGGSAYPYQEWAIIYPIYMKLAANLGTYTATMGWEFKELNGYSRNELVKYQGGTGKNGSLVTTNNGADVDIYSLESDLAFHGTCPNQAIIMLPY
jgi:hypothetical protein